MNSHDPAEHIAQLQHTIAGLESFNRCVSHDLRGPLGGIAALARLAEGALARADDAMLRRMLDLILFQAQHCTRLVDALLELTRVGHAPLRRSPVDLALLVHEVALQLALGRGEPLPPIRCDTPPQVLADADLLRPALLNLIGNALKFTRGQVLPRIEVAARVHEEGVLVTVRDNGVGFDPAAAAGLFEPFVRLHGPAFEGHGIGLSIVRRAVERHGGRAWAAALRGGGACFSFTLPQHAVHAVHAEQAGPAAAPSAACAA